MKKYDDFNHLDDQEEKAVQRFKQMVEAEAERIDKSNINEEN